MTRRSKFCILVCLVELTAFLIFLHLHEHVGLTTIAVLGLVFFCLFLAAFWIGQKAAKQTLLDQLAGIVGGNDLQRIDLPVLRRINEAFPNNADLQQFITALDAGYVPPELPQRIQKTDCFAAEARPAAI
jgi:hypothetical protein